MTKAPPKPTHINGFRVGDRVITPLGRIAEIVALRLDGYIDARYTDRHPMLAEVILQAKDLRRFSP